MVHLRYVFLSIFVLQILQSRAGRHWMYSKSWIEDYRVEVKYGLPSQSVLTEYSMETHKIGVVQSEDEKSLDDGGYDYRESSTVFATSRTAAVRNKGEETPERRYHSLKRTIKIKILLKMKLGERYEGQLVSDLITVPKNVTHDLPDLRVDIVLLEKVSEEAVNFIGLLEAPISDGYSSFSASLRNKENTSVCYEFMFCGNHRRSDMLSIGYMHVHYNGDSKFDRSVIQDAAVIDPYLFMVVVKSLTVNGTSLATCEELNVRGAIFDNTVPGIYLPFTIYQRFMREIFAYADRYDFPKEMRIWERRGHSCYEAPVAWNDVPEVTFTFFAKEDEAFQVSYSGQSLVQRYYTKNSRSTTFCYIFAIRRGENKHLVFGRTAFEGLKLIFNRSGQVLSFLENSCCGPRIKLRSATNIHEKMSSCLPRHLRSTIFISHFEAYWIWIFALAIVVAVLTCILSAPRPLNRGCSPPPTIHIFIPQTGTLPCEFNCQEKSTDTAE